MEPALDPAHDLEESTASRRTQSAPSDHVELEEPERPSNSNRQMAVAGGVSFATGFMLLQMMPGQAPQAHSMAAMTHSARDSPKVATAATSTQPSESTTPDRPYSSIILPRPSGVPPPPPPCLRSPPPPPSVSPPPPPLPHFLPPSPPLLPPPTCLSHIQATHVRKVNHAQLWVSEGQGNLQTLQISALAHDNHLTPTAPKWTESFCISTAPRKDPRTCFDIRDLGHEAWDKKPELLHFGCVTVEPFQMGDRPRAYKVNMDGGAELTFTVETPSPPSPPMGPSPPHPPPSPPSPPSPPPPSPRPPLPAGACKTCAKHQANGDGLTVGKCNAMMREDGGKLWKMWSYGGWGFRAPGGQACFDADPEFFPKLLRGEGCDRNWYAGTVDPAPSQNGAPALLGFDETIYAYCSAELGLEEGPFYQNNRALADRCIQAGENVLRLMNGWNICENAKWQLCAALGNLPGQGEPALHFSIAPSALDVEIFRNPDTLVGAYAISDVYFLEICLYSHMCKNREALFELAVGELFTCDVDTAAVLELTEIF